MSSTVAQVADSLLTLVDRVNEGIQLNKFETSSKGDDLL